MSSFSSTSEHQVLVEVKRCAVILTLNRPDQLNAASFYMVSRLRDLFTSYESDPDVKLIILKGKGKAFSVGGDVAAVVNKIKQGRWKLGSVIFRDVLFLNYLMATYSKPQVSILNGIVMGGGAGCSVHGRFRVATEKSKFAMPETALGLFPDSGSSYFLSRLPGFFGEYLGLTGASLDGAEMLACGLATHYVPSSKLAALEADLCESGSSDAAVISSIIDSFGEQPKPKRESAYNSRLDVINRCFGQRTVEEIISCPEGEAGAETNAWMIFTIQSLKKASPTSLKITLRSIREGRLQGIRQCIVREYRMACHVLRGKLSKDFLEGCRAILLDKDRNPKWEPSRLDLVTKEMVDKYFERLDDEDWEELNLPPRSNLPLRATAKL
ncbi:hypothetical protein MLD38_037420 [Melastoma candidum]|uniref:Uncharacterized protein n=1 Tax=Melastoma candidum TaxID=119954 RepID=A0ACB9LMM7_9MYRT|nr:hypothetical protein MLD38_037420 [Melastoma candidum]